MVLQRDVVVPVWGWGAPGEKITVNFAGQSRATQAGADGKWSVTLSRLSRGDATTLIVQGTNTIMIDDVLVGEVGLGSGQATP